MRWLIAIILITVSVTFTILFFKGKILKFSPNKLTGVTVTNYKAATILRLRNHSADIKTYAAKNKFNTQYCFLVDMSIASGENRFFVYDLKTDSTVVAGLVTHGSGKVPSAAIRFSNKPQSNCTSLGKYKIGNAYNGKFGLAFKLHGIDKTNSNAFNRFVVLHSHSCVPMMEVAPQKICESWGCPTVSPLFLQMLKKYIDKADKPLLLFIYN